MPPHAPCNQGWRACQPFLAHALTRSQGRRLSRAALAAQAAKRNRAEASGGSRGKGPLYVTVEPDGSDLWRLDPIIDMLKEGAVRPSLPSICARCTPCQCQVQEPGGMAA